MKQKRNVYENKFRVDKGQLIAFKEQIGVMELEKEHAME